MIDEEDEEVNQEEEYGWNGGRVSTEDDGDNRTKSTSLIYQETGSQDPYLCRIFPNPYLSIKPSTLTTQCDFFYLSLYR